MSSENKLTPIEIHIMDLEASITFHQRRIALIEKDYAELKKQERELYSKIAAMQNIIKKLKDEK